MADVGFRDLGSFVPGQRREEPTGAPPSARVAAAERAPETAVIVTEPPAKRQPLFDDGQAGGADALGRDGLLGHLAELVTHGRTAVPLTLGFLGGPGFGKSINNNKM